MSAANLQSLEERIRACESWPERCPEPQWSIYRRVLANIRERGIQFAIGGAFAAMTYAGQWRNTKDFDLYILERDRDDLVRILSDIGLRDYYEKVPYDRKWIHRTYTEDVIVDVIWSMANGRARVDESWFRGPEVQAGGERFHLLAPEEALWTKLYVVQRDRCDWPDALNLIYGVGPEMDWRHLLDRTRDDAPLLLALLLVFRWLAPERARELPAWLWEEMDSIRTGEVAGVSPNRASLLDSRPWFTPVLGPGNQ